MAWVTRSPYAGAVVVKDGGGTRGNHYAHGVMLPNGNLRVWHANWPDSQGYNDSTDRGATWGAQTDLNFWGLTPLVDGGGGGVVKVRKGAVSGRYHAVISKYTLTGSYAANYPDGPGWDIYYDTYYAWSDDCTTWHDLTVIPRSRLSFLGMDVVELANGHILVTGEEIDRGSGAYFRNAGPLQTNCYLSTDAGASWVFRGTLCDEAVTGYRSYEPQHVMVADGTTYGKLIAFMAKYPNGSTYERHMRTSANGGATWSSPTSFGDTQNRCGVCATPDGDIIFCHSINGYSTTKWWVSRDNGTSWTDMGDVLSGTTQPSANTGGYIANKWMDPFVIGAAGASPNLGIAWGAGADDAHGSSFFRAFSRGADGAAALTIAANSVWSQSGTTLTVNSAPSGTRSIVSGTAGSVNGGLVRFTGTHADRFSVSLDGSTFTPTVTVPAGTTTVYLGVTPQAGDTTLSAKVGIPV